MPVGPEDDSPGSSAGPEDGARDVAATLQGSRSVQGLVEAISEGLIESGWLVALVAVPLLFNVDSVRIFEPEKVALLRLLVVVMLAAWIAKLLAGGRLWTAVENSGGPGRAEPRAPRDRRRWVGLLLPVAAHGGSMILSASLSVSPWRSWLGSYQRQQGLITSLCYLAIFLAIVAHLRREEQWRRIRFAIVMSSVPAAGYAVLQHLGRDPIRFAHGAFRVGSTMGNPVFLGAFLVIALLVTSDAIADTIVRARVSSPGLGRLGLLRKVAAPTAFCALAAAQVGGIGFAESRGPIAALIAGAAVALMLAWLVAVRPQDRVPGREVPRPEDAPRLRRFVGPGLLVAALVVLVLSLALIGRQPGMSREPGSSAPRAGRLGAAFDAGDETRRVRLVVWKSVVELAVATPLRPPSGEPDRFRAIRWLVGYGPECFDLAFNRVYPAALGRIEHRNVIPDRAHNEVFDLLVMQGALGLATWLWLLAAVLSGLLRRIGIGPGRRFRCGPGRWLSAGGAAGVGLAILVLRSPDLAGLGLVVGGLGGLFGGAIVSAVIGERRTSSQTGRARTRILLAAVIVAHVVETAVGLAVTPTRLLFWALLAVVIADEMGWISLEGETAVTGTGEQPEGAAPQGRGALAWPLLTGCAMAVPIFGLSGGSGGTGGDIQILARLLGTGGGRGVVPSAFVILALGSLAVATPTLLLELRAGRVERRRSWSVAIGIPLLLAAAGWLLAGYRLAAGARMQRAGASGVALAQYVAGNFAAFAGLFVVFAALVAAAIGWRPMRDGTERPLPLILTLVLVLVFVAGAAQFALGPLLDPIRADTLAKQADAHLDVGDTDGALSLLAPARALAPREPMVLTATARAAVAGMQARQDPVARGVLLAAGLAALERAARFEPLDPDHPVNRARVLVAAVELEGSEDARAAMLAEAAAKYREGLELRPQSALFRVELAGVLLRLHDTAAAIGELKRTVRLDPTFEVPAMMLAAVEYELAVKAARSGDDRGAMSRLEAAFAVLGELRRYRPDHWSSRRVLAVICSPAGRADGAVAYRALFERGGERMQHHQMLALLAAETGDRAAAVRHGTRALELATAALRPEAASGLALLEHRSGLQNPSGSTGSPPKDPE